MNPVITLWYIIMIGLVFTVLPIESDLVMAISTGGLVGTILLHGIIVSWKSEYIEELHLNNMEYRVVQLITNDVAKNESSIIYQVQQRLIFPIGWGKWTARVVHLHRFSYALRSSEYEKEEWAVEAVNQLMAENERIMKQKKVDRLSKRNSRTSVRVVYWKKNDVVNIPSKHKE